MWNYVDLRILDFLLYAVKTSCMLLIQRRQIASIHTSTQSSLKKTLSIYPPKDHPLTKTSVIFMFIALVSRNSYPNSIHLKQVDLTSYLRTFEINRSLAFLFQQSFNSGIVPTEWKHALVTPIHKSGDKCNPFNYRPISLTCICCKVMEHIVLSHISKHIYINQQHLDGWTTWL